MRNKIMTITFLIIIFSAFIAFICIPDIKLSFFERRNLSQFPTKFDEDVTEELDDYIVDQFPLRNTLIKLNSLISRNVYGIKDTNDVYVVGDMLVDKEYPMKDKEVAGFVNKMNKVISTYLGNSNVYYSVIPDKAYFLDSEEYLKLDYNKFFETVKEINGKYIDVTSVLELNDYYKTDIHWKQENLDKIVKTLVPNMGKNYIETEYQTKTYLGFAGASYSKAGGVVEKDTLNYLTNYVIENAKVTHLEYKDKKVYDEPKLTGVDPYDVFLSGATSYIEIENIFSDTTDELVIFRDSFSSSLIPLLLPYYSKITVIDLRYITLDIAASKTAFDGKDVLMLYSVPVINSSSTLKVY